MLPSSFRQGSQVPFIFQRAVLPFHNSPHSISSFATTKNFRCSFEFEYQAFTSLSLLVAFFPPSISTLPRFPLHRRLLVGHHASCDPTDGRRSLSSPFDIGYLDVLFSSCCSVGCLRYWPSGPSCPIFEIGVKHPLLDTLAQWASNGT